nr:unnamed protein product [Callosobruchus chinensis]CAH7768461.1 unnamed protein product [Callosobruchus chinensis]
MVSPLLPLPFAGHPTSRPTSIGVPYPQGFLRYHSWLAKGAFVSTAEQPNDLGDRWTGACLEHKTLIQILCLGGFTGK